MAKRRCKECGFAPCRCEDLTAEYMGRGNMPMCWPMVNTALGVHPKQSQEATDDARAKGVPTEFKKDGRPIFTDRKHYAAYCAAYGYPNNGAGYSDYNGPSRRSERQERAREVEEHDMKHAYGDI